jgi:hypothetical protein
VLNTAFMSMLEHELELRPVPCYTHFLVMMRHLHTSVTSLQLMKHASVEKRVLLDTLKTTLSRVLDVNFITRQTREGFFNWGSCVKLMGDIMQALYDYKCALVQLICETQHIKPVLPMPNQSPVVTKNLWSAINSAMWIATSDISTQPVVLVRALVFIQAEVDAVCLSVKHFSLELARVFVTNHGVVSRRATVNGQISSGELKLDVTSSWLLSTMQGDSTTLLGDYTKKTGAGKQQVVVALVGMGIANIICAAFNRNNSVDEKTIPETLQVDMCRISKMRQQFKLYLSVSIVAVVLRDWFARNGAAVVGPTLPAFVLHLCAEKFVWVNGTGLVSAAMKYIKTHFAAMLLQSAGSSRDDQFAKLQIELLACLADNGNNCAARAGRAQGFSKHLRGVFLFGMEQPNNYTTDVCVKSTFSFPGPVPVDIITVLAPLIRGLVSLTRRVAEVNANAFGEQYNQMVLKYVTALFTLQFQALD